MPSLDNLFLCDFLVFIAGIKVPDAKVSLTSSLNALPTCNIAMPPYAELFGIGRQDRLPVQVFMSDTLTKNATVDDLSSYQLLFDGELTDFGYISSQRGRSFVINAEAIPGFLKDIQMDVATTVEERAKASIPSGGLGGILLQGHSAKLFPSSLLLKGLAPATNTSDTIDTPTEFLDNIVEFLSGDDVQPDSIMVQFYKTFLEKINFKDRYVPLPYFDDDKASWNSTSGGAFPLLKGLQYKSEFFNTLMQMANDVPKKASLYTLINFIVSTMEYEWSFISAPSMTDGKMVQTCLKPLFYEAVPPSCNIVTRAMNAELSLHEKVADVPTRLRFRDLYDPITTLTKSTNNFITDLAVVDYYPHGTVTESELPSTTKPFVTELMEEKDVFCELYSGPKVVDLLSPPWLSYAPHTDAETSRTLTENVMKHMYFLKRYETRRLSVSMAFNPYITVGYPAIVYDAESTGIVLIGHVLSVQHSISKKDLSTRMELGYARLLSEEKANRLENVLKEISDEVTHDTKPMTEIYNALLGDATYAVSLDYEPSDAQQTNPYDAYLLSRRNLATLADYVEFMPNVDGLDSADMHMTGTYYTDRFDTDLRDTLSELFAADPGYSVFA